jgi:hypothetical protein
VITLITLMAFPEMKILEMMVTEMVIPMIQIMDPSTIITLKMKILTITVMVIPTNLSMIFNTIWLMQMLH